MAEQEYAMDAVDVELSCVHCGRPIVAVGTIFGDIEIAGLRQYRWRHKAGAWNCEPPDVPPTAKPYDAWEATRRVEAILKARRKALDAYEEAVEGLPYAPGLLRFLAEERR